MSSARNHARRSHRSEHAKRSCINTAARKTIVKQMQKPKRIGLLERLTRRTNPTD